ncbi:hypothetical protein [Alloalcanivorax xenomutans]|uniref:hypothetical protein n=1 Tax=Alloalcanivorax xenomutans TaxID=1094342 RepID=UPI0015F2CA6E|nr:hypothetical protein [Alloalcanivorax xenomutans]MBA4723400.1 hypothetical protein [Alcanivorax sp.]WOA30155.1 hypothetical protein RVY87_14840 [Alloalcanivorax xenomutans]
MAVTAEGGKSLLEVSGKYGVGGTTESQAPGCGGANLIYVKDVHNMPLYKMYF